MSLEIIYLELWLPWFPYHAGYSYKWWIKKKGGGSTNRVPMQNCWRKSFLNTQNPGASGRLRTPGPSIRAKGSALNPLETLSGPQTPRRLSSPLTQNHGSAPVKGNGFWLPFGVFTLFLLESLIGMSFVSLFKIT